jgi:uncharacterized protein (TIGR03437 family)
MPESGAIIRTPAVQSPRAYALGRYVYRSDDSGAHWENLVAFRDRSIIGEGLRDLAVNPSNEDEIVVAGALGVFRSMDGGKSWSGLNQGLPNLPEARLRSLPLADRGTRLELADASVIEWQPGERVAWRSDDNRDAVAELSLRRVLTLQKGLSVTAVTISGDYVYAGMADGSIEVSSDRARTAWQRSVNNAGAVTRIWVDAGNPRVAVATFATRPREAGATPVLVMRTLNGGLFWDNITSDLGEGSAYSVTGDAASGAVYVATDRGVFFTRTDLSTLGLVASSWTRLPGLPDSRAMDVQLDGAGNQLWAALEGYGVYVTLAPHRIGDPKIISSADFVARAAAPGALMSIAGARIDSARAGNLSVPVLAATDTESQIQVPFEARGDILSISVDTAGVRRELRPLPLGSTSPAIFVDRDGGPLLLDVETGMMLDAMHPARSRSRIQILATGLGRVTPDWPSGMAAPLENPPQVAAGVKAWLDRAPVEVARAVLAPGYVGFYLVEIEIPAIVNYGPAELYIEAAGQASNRVRVYIEP